MPALPGFSEEPSGGVVKSGGAPASLGAGFTARPAREDAGAPFSEEPSGRHSDPRKRMIIDNEETKNTKISSILTSCSSFPRGYFRAVFLLTQSTRHF
jgi:hypothetical protein